ncbi:MAG: hypothetical protein LPK80_09715 [Bacteroidota bacterium]|nr:hypothetical protein [Bacteroidota bacterium]MDX5429337.1 hypothetical protein [Bacteroidota bacterium]MDX5448521.1 hypothetical protein [Bacteroidota bacterium]MDX5506937.1 hypothetical protein [Bacteroidota bacterium]
MTQWLQRSVAFMVAWTLFSSCEKPPEPEGSPNPVFYVNGSQDGGGDFVVHAGQFGVYMHTGVANDSMGIKYYYGVVGQKDTSKGEYMEFRFRSYSKAGENGPNPEPLFHTGRYDLFSAYREKASEKEVEFSFFPSDIGSPVSSFIWNIDGNSFTSNIPIITMDTTVEKDVDVILAAQFTSGCLSDQRSVLMTNRVNEHVGLSYSLIGKGQVEFFADVPNGFSNVEWTVNDISLGRSPSKIVNLVPGTQLKVTALASNPHGIISETRNFTVVDTNIIDYCHADFTIRQREVMVEDHDQFGTVEILYRDKDGRIYSSRNILEPGYVDVLKIESYIPNENGVPTKKLTLEGNFRLQAQDGNIVHFNSFSGVIAVAY